MTIKNETTIETSLNKEETMKRLEDLLTEFYHEFVKLPPGERQEKMKFFDEAAEFFKDRPRVVTYFGQIKDAFVQLDAQM